MPLGIHALVGGNLVIKPGERIEAGVIVIRDGRIEAVGKEIGIPADARVWDLKGTTLYAGFIEPYFPVDSARPPLSTSEAFPVNESSFAAGGTQFYGAPGTETDQSSVGYEIARIHPQARMVEKPFPKEDAMSSLRELGFTAGVIVPAKGILRGSSALISLATGNPNGAVLRSDVFQHIAFDTTGNESGAYPNSLMGVIASVRQAFHDARHDQLARTAYEKTPHGGKRPDFDPALNALAPVLNRQLPVAFEAGSALMNDRAAQLGNELGFDFCLVASGEEWRRPDRLASTGATYLVPVHFPSAPKLPSDEDWDQISLDHLRAWDWAPENPALLRQHGMTIALTTYGMNDRKSFRKNLQLALDRGLSENDALAALTTVPAKLCGVENQLGTIEAGKLANLVVVEGRSYFDPESKIKAVWIDGRIFPNAATESPVAKSDKPKPAPEESSPADTTPPKEEPEKHPQPPEVATATAGTTNTPAVSTSKKEHEEKTLTRDLQKNRVARSPLAGRGPITNPPSVLIRGVTLWTCGPAGVLTNAQLLFADGRIQEVGHFKVELSADTVTLDLPGLHLTPGIVDCHSHAAILGNGNETGVPSSAMVRIADVVNSETDNLYEQLANGVTTINLLHGSANPIGGQNCVIKLRDGLPPDALVFEKAPAGIKFALGENVKQANWGEKFTTRFPQTRMGVRTFIQNRFVAAQQYRDAWNAFQSATNDAVPPRRDLELEAIAEILEGRRWIHCHAYRQDEMLMLTRLMQEFGVQIGTFQHALEAYKIADELASANIGVSMFSDWWGFKYELFDAIPYNGSLSRDRGVMVSFNSDFSELARRLYLEAAKAVKYGGVPETEALKFITINPAKQLRIDRYVGSLESGKDADFAVWSKSPLDSGTLCLQTWIDGKKYFDRNLHDERVEQLKEERRDLIAKAKKIAKPAAGGTTADATGGKSFFSTALELDHSEWSCGDE